jgi:pSer/pThr/pTyr-binding forkhead associated (FHA) protein
MARIYLEYQGNSIELPPGENVLGRDMLCRIRFNDPSVSRRHVRILVDYKSAIVEDLGSTNGSSVNGERLAGARPLGHGDQLKMGSRILKVAVLADAAPPEAEPDTLNEAMDQLAAEAAAKAAEGPESTTTRRTQRTPALPSPRELAAKAAEQKCPECGHVVGAEMDACPSCGYFWTAGRPNARTLVPPVRTGGTEEERRENVRVPVTVPVLYMSDTLTFESQARDLSRGGMFIRTELLDPVGTPCMLTVLPDGGAAVVMQGVVAHVVESRVDKQGRSPGLGVKFASLSPDADRWLGHALEERTKRV